ncbi:MAG TPA: SusD/RagB family nutrient-binding outer membrane lipoprotein [Bacteroidia bacterium]|nr:SusD/RagB family nutrient-binding outer membrane lipoprotein [Bacteroidia bacterium]
MIKFKINQKAIATVMVFSLLLGSCKKNFESINEDPNNPKEVPNAYLLTGAIRGLMDNTIDAWWGANVGNQLGQYWSSNQYSSESRYLYRSNVTNSYWRYFYGGVQNDQLVAVGGLYELSQIVKKCKEDSIEASRDGYVPNQIAVATIVRVWTFQNMTDIWGDIPYSEALQADANKSPKYDKQEDIYNGLLSEIDEAIAMINDAESGPNGDVVYNGDMAAWKKFANSLKMRLALRIVDRNPAKAQSEFEAAFTAGAFSANSDNALLQYGEFPSGNPIYYNRYISGRNDYASSNTFLDSTLTPLNDPRRECFFVPATATGLWTGEVYGLSEANAAQTPNSRIAQRSPLVLSASLPGIFMDYAQVEFMLAEAAERGWAVTGSAESHYDAGITASISFWTELNGSPASAGDIAAYIAQPTVNYQTAGGTWQQRIGVQKWIALFDQGIQGWVEWRRLDFNKLMMPADGVIDGTGIPLRMKYPVLEQTPNSASYSAAVAAQGADEQDTRMWWDVN